MGSAESEHLRSPRTPDLFLGAIWATLNAAVSVGFPLLLFVYFARVVPHAQLGLAAVALAAVELVKALVPQGLYEVLVRPQARPAEARAAFGVLLAAGAGGAALYVVGVLAAARAWPELAAVRAPIAVLAGKILLDVAVLQPQAALARRAAFRPLALRVMLANLAGPAVGVGLALTVAPLWGLVGAYLAQSAVLLSLTVLWSRPWVRPSLDLSALRPIAREAGMSTAVRLAAAAISYLDQLVLALFVPAAAVARFNLGKRIENLLFAAQTAFAGVMFQPAFALGPAEARAATIQRCRAVLTAVCGVPVAAFAAAPGPLVSAVFGPSWVDAAAPAALLAVSGLARLHDGVHGALMSVSGRNSTLLAYALCSAVAGAAIVAATARFGLTAVAAALAVKNVVGLFVAAWLTRRDAPRPVAGLIRQVVAPVLAMWAAAELARLAVGGEGWAGFAAAAVAAVAAGALMLGPGLVALARERHAPAVEPAAVA